MKGGCDVTDLPLLQIFQSPHSASTTYWTPWWTVQGHMHTFGIFLLGFGFQFVLLCQSTNFFKESTNKYFGKQYGLCRRRQWHPTPVLLPGKSHGQRSLVGCSPGGRWVGLDWATSLSLFPFMHWRRKWHPTPVFLPGESQGRGSLMGCRLWGRTVSDTTAAT